MAEKANVAWRCILLHLSQRLRQGEPQKISFLYELPDRFRRPDVPGEEVLERLEMNGEFSCSSPDGLVDIFVNIGRKDLSKQAKEKIKDYQTKIWKEDSLKCQCARLHVACRSAIFHANMTGEQISKSISLVSHSPEQTVSPDTELRRANLLLQMLKSTLQKASMQIGMDDDTTLHSTCLEETGHTAYQNRSLPLPIHSLLQPSSSPPVSPSRHRIYRRNMKLPEPETNHQKSIVSPKEECGSGEDEEPLYAYVDELLSADIPGSFERKSRLRVPIKRSNKLHESLPSLTIELEEEELDKDKSDIDLHGYDTVKQSDDDVPYASIEELDLLDNS